jgi:hypothetical protein
LEKRKRKKILRYRSQSNIKGISLRIRLNLIEVPLSSLTSLLLLLSAAVTILSLGSVLQEKTAYAMGSTPGSCTN